MERWSAPGNIKKETQVCYNYGVKKYLARNYKKLKTKVGPPKK